MKLSLRFKIAFAASLCVFFLLPEREFAAQKTTESILRIPHCTVSLIDEVTLAAGRSGLLSQVLYREGDQVEAKTLVAQLANEEAAAQEALADYAAKSDIAIRLAEKICDAAETELQNGYSLNERRQVLTEFEIRRLELAFEQAKLEVEQATHDRELKNLERGVAHAQTRAHDIRSTFAGTVVQVFKDAGEAVQQGEPLLRIVNDQRLKIEGFAPAAAARQLKVGQPARIEITSPEGKSSFIQGRLKFVDISIQPVTQEVRLWVEVDNKEGHLKSGQIVALEFSDDPESNQQ